MTPKTVYADGPRSGGPWIYTDCTHCGVTFGQPDDPGRKREYHSPACRQAAYRTRTGRTGHEARETAQQRRERAWAEAEAARRRARAAGKARPSTARDRAAVRIPLLLAKAMATPYPAEAAAFQAKADELAAKYGL